MDLARGAHEQANTQARLQPRDRAADGGRAQAGGQGRGGEAFQLGREAEQLQAAEHQVVELAAHICSIT
jgi:hypothetical protein